MTAGRFEFARGNLGKLLALPKYLLAFVLSWFVPRRAAHWAFGSAAGVGEGALAVALEVRERDPEATVYWLVGDERERAAALSHEFRPVTRNSWSGFWVTLRAGTLIVTHGLGDVNRFGVFGGLVVQLWHGAPLKRIHLDSPVTTTLRGPAPLRALLRFMYERGARQVNLYVAGSIVAAERLRSAFQVDPGRVRVLGDPRDDVLALRALDPSPSGESRTAVLVAIDRPDLDVDTPLVLYAPTWRDGAADPAIPSPAEIETLHSALTTAGAHLIIRSHPLGAGNYEGALGDRVHLLGSDHVRDITPLLDAFDAVITDYSSIAIDYSLLSRPIVWFAPDIEAYTLGRGLYEPLEVTSAGRIERTWAEVCARLGDTLDPTSLAHRESRRSAEALATRFHAHRDGASAARVVAEITKLRRPLRELVPDGAVFFESYYGRQVSCNPLALDREIATRSPGTPRLWSVVSELQKVPAGATPLLVGGREWFAARRHARLLIVNDWLRYGFRRSRTQFVLQTWHGTMLKHLALGRPNVTLRTRLAIHRERRRWSAMLSQNPHSTSVFRSSYAFTGPIIEAGYPRDDRLARATIGEGRNPVLVQTARAALGVPEGKRVLAYAPTWRDRALTVVDDLSVHALAEDLGDDWVVVARGHTRSHALGGYGARGNDRVIDASKHPDVNDVILAADLLVTDYSSLMFDAAVVRVPLAFFVPDLAAYRDRERGFTFDFERAAPGPLLTSRDAVVACAHELAAAGAAAAWVREYRSAYDSWRERFTPHDDGAAAARVIDRLEALGAWPVD